MVPRVTYIRKRQFRLTRILPVRDSHDTSMCGAFIVNIYFPPFSGRPHGPDED